ncbi:MAG: hypothetical protein L0H74_04515 [Brachybacterium sp.]|nr:hypothetical protein [Brachybacterium sp.]
MADHDTTRIELNRELESLGRRRERTQQAVEEIKLEIGATAKFLRDELDQAKAESARMVGISPSHMTEWMANAARCGHTIADPFARVPLLSGAELQEHVSRHGGLARILASFERADPLYMSGVDPTRLVSGGVVVVPNMLISTRDGDWVAVRNVNVGYAGTGPSNAIRELSGLGLDPDLAEQIASRRVSDVTLCIQASDPQAHFDDAPPLGLPAPQPLHDWFVSPVELEDTFQVLRRRKKVRDPDRHLSPLLERWLNYLDRPREELPAWLHGSRHARVYLDRSAAQADGFAPVTLRPGAPPSAVYPLLIEQGQLQLWVDLPTSNDPTVLFTNEIYDALGLAGFYTHQQRARDAKSAFWRWLHTLGARRPAYVDLHAAGLRHVPGIPHS